MSDINRLPPICEVCVMDILNAFAGFKHLNLAACGGGAAGDIWLCNQHMLEHQRVCEECDAQAQALYQFQL